MLVRNNDTQAPFNEGDLYVYQNKQYSIQIKKFKVISIQERDKSVSIYAKDIHGDGYNINFWKNSSNPNLYTDDDGKYHLVEIKENDIVDFIGFEYNYMNNKQFNAIGGYRLSEDQTWSFNAGFDTSKCENRIRLLLSQITDVPLRSACEKAFTDVYQDFMLKPAANKHHHNYIGGLVLHTAEVMSVAYNIAKCFNCDINTVIAASFFHDIMKINEYEQDGNYLPYAGMIGHVTGSAMTFRNYASAFNVSRSYFDNITHAILAHHGRKEWGSPVEPVTPEAVCVHEADMVSSRINPMFVQSKPELQKDYYINW